MTYKQKNRALDAEWTPLEGEHDPAAYSRRCRRIQRAKSRRKVVYAQRLLAIAVTALVVAAAVALVYI